MADVFHQLYIQVVFAVKNRQALIEQNWENDLFKYTTGIIQNRGNKLLAIGGMPDHIHIFLAIKPSESLSDLVREIKKSTQAFITDQKLTPFNFQWQKGYGAFTYSRSELDTVCKYVLNQRTHHKKKNFKDEFIDMMNLFEIEQGRKVIFDFFD